MSAKSITKVFLTGLGLVGGGIAGLSLWAQKNNFQSPLFLARYLNTPNSLVGPLFENRQIRRADEPFEIPQKIEPIDHIVTWKQSHRGLSWVLRETETNVLLVAKDGVIVRRWTRPGYTESTPQSSWSVAKSVVGILAGQLIAARKLRYDTKLVEILPEYSTGGPFDEITVEHLLDMKSGIDVSEEYKEWEAYTGVGGLMTTKDLPSYLMKNRNLFAVPGSVSDYRSVDTQFLSMIVSRVAGEPLSVVAKKRLWDPIGAMDHATWSLDHADGIEKGFMGLNASARDFMKIGLLIQSDGKFRGKQIIPKQHLKKIFTPAGTIESDSHNWEYSGCWWHPSGATTGTDITALGVYGQFVYVNKEKNVTIVKLSDYGAEQDEDELISVFRQLSDDL